MSLFEYEHTNLYQE